MQISDAISILALTLTFALSLHSLFLTKKINKINLNSHMFEQLFVKILFESLPLALEDAYITQLENTDKLEETIIELNIKIKCYKYIDSKFYDKVYKEITQIDDFLVLLKGRKQFNGYEESKILEDKIKELYSIFMTRYVEGN